MRYPSPHPIATRASALAVALTVSIAGCSSGAGDTRPAVSIGLLLPYTGSGSATAANFERAVLYAAERINRAGGVRGFQVRIVPRDSHSDITRSTQAVSDLVAAGASIVLGPESADIAPELYPLLVANHVSLMSPLVGAGADPHIDCTHPWFRLAPSAQVLGEALAKLIAAQNVTRVALLSSSTSYDQALRDAVSSRFTSLGGQVAIELALDPAAQSYADAITQTVATGADAIVVATPPESAALLVNEFGAIAAKRPRWFLSPLLKTDLFVLNVAPDAIEGALGVAPRIYDTTTDFSDAFSKRWAGDTPLEGADFYYDAMGLVGLALENVPIGPDGKADSTALEAAVVKVAAPPGVSVAWSEIETGLSRTAAGETIYYSGLTGPMLLDACGVRKLGITSSWGVVGGSIVPLP
jgi:branched-chain amino acid transport system substrate-binding protein